MQNNSHNDKVSIAVDQALLKLSKKHGISIPNDDPVIALTLLNAEIIEAVFSDSVSTFQSESQKSVKHFRDALSIVAKQHNQKMKNVYRALTACVALTAFSVALLAYSIITK